MEVIPFFRTLHFALFYTAQDFTESYSLSSFERKEGSKSSNVRKMLLDESSVTFPLLFSTLSHAALVYLIFYQIILNDPFKALVS